jgi:hypothetical protein
MSGPASCIRHLPVRGILERRCRRLVMLIRDLEGALSLS